MWRDMREKINLNPNPKSQLQPPPTAQPPCHNPIESWETTRVKTPLQQSTLRLQTLAQDDTHIEGEQDRWSGSKERENVTGGPSSCRYAPSGPEESRSTLSPSRDKVERSTLGFAFLQSIKLSNKKWETCLSFLITTCGLPLYRKTNHAHEVSFKSQTRIESAPCAAKFHFKHLFCYIDCLSSSSLSSRRIIGRHWDLKAEYKSLYMKCQPEVVISSNSKWVIMNY